MEIMATGLCFFANTEKVHFVSPKSSHDQTSLHPVPKCGCGGNRGYRYPDGREAQPGPAMLRLLVVIWPMTQCCRQLR